MTSKKTIQSIDIFQFNDDVNYDFNELPSLSPEPILRQSLFFHIKQNQHLDKSNSSTNIEDLPIKSVNLSRSSLPTIYSGYQRKKSQSVKLIRIEENGSSPKKTVRFADDFGLDLSQTKVIKTDEIPQIPITAFQHLHIHNGENLSTVLNQEQNKIYMKPQFENPIYIHNFFERVSKNKVILEQANAYNNQIQGTIRLISFSLDKQVKVRLTTDNWLSFRDYDTTYINDSYDGNYDRFSFIVEVDRHRVCVGNNIQFCIFYKPFGGQEYWDNNYQQNYRFNCLSRDNI